jgi:isopentenyldiphosphate isomerase
MSSRDTVVLPGFLKRRTSKKKFHTNEICIIFTIKKKKKKKKKSYTYLLFDHI